MKSKLDNAEILVVRLRIDCVTGLTMDYSTYLIINESDESYEVSLIPDKIFVNDRKHINKDEINEVKYVEFFAAVEEHNYWNVEAYVYAMDKNKKYKLEEELYFWSHCLYKKLKQGLKKRNKHLKQIYTSVDELSIADIKSS